jgi:hypothetical protein
MNNGTLSIDGTATERNLFRGSGQDDADEESAAVNGSNAAGTPFTWTTLTFTDFIDNGGELEFGRHAGPVLTDNCFFAYNDVTNGDLDGSDTGIRHGYAYDAVIMGPAPVVRTIQNCTIFDGLNPGVGAVQYGLNYQGLPDNLEVTLSNVIIAGSSDIGLFLRDGGDSVMNVNDSALVTAGQEALSATVSGTADGPGTGNWDLNISNLTTESPLFHDLIYVYGSTTEFLRVGNANYALAGPAGGQLTGAGGGIIPLVVDDWERY